MLIGLTGSMGVGKTTVLNIMEEMSFKVINTDIYIDNILKNNLYIKKKFILILEIMYSMII